MHKFKMVIRVGILALAGFMALKGAIGMAVLGITIHLTLKELDV